MQADETHHDLTALAMTTNTAVEPDGVGAVDEEGEDSA
jgi:hypothetical protein